MQKNLVYIACMCAFFSRASQAYFDTLPEMIAYAAKIPSDTPNESVKPFYPQFSTLHNRIPRLTETSIRAKVSNLFLGRTELVREFEHMLNNVALDREFKGYYGNFVQKFYIEEQTKWYIWGSLHGAFHSLVRGLVELKKNHLLDDNLKLLNSTTYLIFNGNMINYGAYQIETLLVILKLVEKNPSRVLLVKGQFEWEGVWQKTNFKDELRTRIAEKNKEDIPLKKEINAFFNTFALAIYLVSTEDEIVRVSFYDKHPLLQESLWGDFLNEKRTEVRKIQYIPLSPTEPKIKARIISHAVQEIPYNIQDLAYSQDGNVQVWSIFSAPLSLFRAYFNFYTDVLVELATGRFFSGWKLTLFTQNPDEPKGYVRSSVFDVATGKVLFTADPAKSLSILAEKIEIAEAAKKRLLQGCKLKQENDESNTVKDVHENDKAEIKK